MTTITLKLKEEQVEFAEPDGMVLLELEEAGLIGESDKGSVRKCFELSWHLTRHKRDWPFEEFVRLVSIKDIQRLSGIIEELIQIEDEPKGKPKGGKSKG